MSEDRRHNIRVLLKQFGIKADGAITEHLAKLGDGAPALNLCVTLEDMTDYGDSPPDHPLRVELDGEV